MWLGASGRKRCHRGDGRQGCMPLCMPCKGFGWCDWKPSNDLNRVVTSSPLRSSRIILAAEWEWPEGEWGGKAGRQWEAYMRIRWRDANRLAQVVAVEGTRNSPTLDIYWSLSVISACTVIISDLSLFLPHCPLIQLLACSPTFYPLLTLILVQFWFS